MKKRIYEYKNRRVSFTRESELTVHWELNCSPIMAEYDWEHYTWRELFDIWVKYHTDYTKDELVSITWHIEQEAMPYQYNRKLDDNFLTYFTHPICKTTGEEVNFLKLPVADYTSKMYKGHPGEVIQRATGWKPSILQPYIHLSALTQAP